MREVISKWAGVLNRWIFSLLCFCVLYFSLFDRFGIPEYSGKHIFPGAVILAVLAVWISRSVSEKIWSFWIGAAAVLLFHFLAGFDRMAAFWKAYGSWLFGGGAYEPEQVPVFCILQLIPIAIIACAVWHLVMCYRYVRIAAAVGISGVLLWCWFANIRLNRQCTAVLFGTLYYLAIYLVQDKWKKVTGPDREKNAKAGYMAFLSPFVLLLFLMLYVSPESEAPLEWHFVKEMVRSVEHKLTSLRLNGPGKLTEDFSMEMDGLSEKAELQGSSVTAPKVLFTMETEAASKTNIYLTGMVYRDFDGRKWGENVRSDSDTVIDSLLTMGAVEFTAEYSTDYIEMGSAHIAYESFHSNEEFQPFKSWRFTEPDETFGSNHYLGYGSEYDVGYLQLNLDNPVWYQLLTDGFDMTEELWVNINRRQFRENHTYSYAELTEYTDRIKSTYSEKTPVSAQLQEWLEQVTASDRDLSSVERLYRIENALAQFVYTRTPGEMPASVQTPSEFLDYFILNRQEGYCTYFATAFVLLARNEGYPARLVTGFCTPSRGEKKTEVTSNMAHAWPEVYFEGIGWIPFEPTPGYGEYRYTPWTVRTSMSYSDADYAEYYKRREQEEEKRRLEEEAKAAEKKAAAASVDYREIIAVAVRTLVAVLLFLVFCAAAYMIQKLLLIRKFSYLTGNDKLSWLYKRNTELLNMLHIRRADNETLEEFADRLRQQNLPGALSQETMEHAVYAGKEAQKADLEVLLSESEEILSYGRAKHKKRARIFVQTMLGKGVRKRVERE